MLRIFSAITASMVFALPAFAADYVSPDGQTTATVSTRSKDDCEATLSFHRKGADDTTVSYVSKDHQSGSCIDHASWTPDSKFFVYSLASSGGHSPWNTPIMFYGINANHVATLEDYEPDPITNPDFVVRAPNQVEFQTTAIPIGSQPPQQRQIMLGTLKIQEK